MERSDEHKSYRRMAQLACERAKQELAGSDDRLPHAAMELRLALEALVYDRAIAFKDVLGEIDGRFWQPQKILEKLVSLDEVLEQPIGISVQLAANEASGEYSEMGKDVPITSKEIRKNYHALGNFVHTPTPDQVRHGGQPAAARIRAKCEDCLSILECQLNATLWNVKAGYNVYLGDCGCEGGSGLSTGLVALWEHKGYCSLHTMSC